MITEADLQKHAAIMALIEELRSADNWCGETHVQKTSYFINVLSNHELGFEFILYKHGPFSFDLGETLSVMASLRYLEDEVPNPRYGPRLKPNPEGSKMLRNQFGELAQKLKPQIAFVVKKLAPYGVAALERLGTALYFTCQERIDSQEDRSRKIHEVKPNITESQALDAVKTVDELLSEWSATAGKSVV
jgi:hypothetical protein